MLLQPPDVAVASAAHSPAADSRVEPHENPVVYGTRIVRGLRLRTMQAKVKALGRVQRDADFRAMLIELYELSSTEDGMELLREWLVNDLGMDRELVF